jgi:hypothetical protein
MQPLTQRLTPVAEAGFRRRSLVVLAICTAGLALSASASLAGTPSPTDGTSSGSSALPTGSPTQLFAPGEVDLSTLGVSATELLGVGLTPSTGDPGGTLIVAPLLSSNCPNAQYHTIQSAVDDAPAGAMIKVCAGTYIEQVLIPAGKDGLTLYSVPDLQAIIKAPPGMIGKEAIVEVNGAQNVTLRHFTITGPGTLCGGNTIRYGVFVGGGGSALITDNHITEIRETPACGTQNGLGVAVGRTLAPDGPTTGSATVVHNLIDNYQKGGVLVDNAGSSAEVAYNEIKGVGPTPAIAQNGIQASRGASANIHHNDVSSNNYLPTDTDSTGILIFNENTGNVSVDHNNTFLNDDGIFLFGGVINTLISHNSSTDNQVTGITADDTTSANTISYNKATGNLVDCVDESLPGPGTPSTTSNFWIKDFGLTENKPGLCKKATP